jgi:hypothetical protein
VLLLRLTVVVAHDVIVVLQSVLLYVEVDVEGIDDSAKAPGANWDSTFASCVNIQTSNLIPALDIKGYNRASYKQIWWLLDGVVGVEEREQG